MLHVFGLVFSFVLLIAGCENATGGDDVQIAVSFTADGTAYALTGWYTDNNVFVANASGAISESGTGSDSPRFPIR